MGLLKSFRVILVDDGELPRLATEHPDRYGELTPKELAEELQAELVESDLTELTGARYARLPEAVIIPADAYHHIVANTVKMLTLTELAESEVLGRRFLAFETGIHGIQVADDGGCRIACLLVDRSPFGARSHTDLATAA